MKNSFLLCLVFSVFVFFGFINRVDAKVYYYDISYDRNLSYLNVYNTLMSNSSLSDTIMSKGVGILNYYSDEYNFNNGTTYVFDAIGFSNEKALNDFTVQYVGLKDAMAKYDDLSYVVILYQNPSLSLTSSGSVINAYAKFIAYLFYNDDGVLLGTFKRNISTNVNPLIQFNFSTYNQNRKDTHCLDPNDSNLYVPCYGSTKNNDISVFSSMFFAKRGNYDFQFNGLAKGDRVIVENVYYQDTKYSLSDSGQYGFWKKMWSNVSSLWDFSPSVSHMLSLTLSKYQSNPMGTLEGGYVTPFEAIFNTEISELPEGAFTSQASVDISANYYGYYFIPIADENYSASDINFYYYRTSYEQSLVASTLDISSLTASHKSTYLSYVLTGDTNETYKYYNLNASSFLKDVNLSMGVETYSYNYKTDIIYMFTDFNNSSFYVYYDSSKFKVISADNSTATIYGQTITFDFKTLRTSIYKKAQDYVGYNGNLYDLGSVNYDGVINGGYDNWKDCLENNCVENSIGIFDDPTKTNIWDRDGWSSLDDIMSSAWSNISGLLASTSAIVLMFNTIFTNLPPIISSAFIMVFMTSMILILLKILL